MWTWVHNPGINWVLTLPHISASKPNSCCHFKYRAGLNGIRLANNPDVTWTGCMLEADSNDMAGVSCSDIWRKICSWISKSHFSTNCQPGPYCRFLRWRVDIFWFMKCPGIKYLLCYKQLWQWKPTPHSHMPFQSAWSGFSSAGQVPCATDNQIVSGARGSWPTVTTFGRKKSLQNLWG